MSDDTIAVIADIHGNSWALDAVLAEIDRRAVTRIVNLGDCAYGSLDPAGTLDRLIARGIPTVSGNQDRVVHAPPPEVVGSADDRFIKGRLSEAQIEWLRALPATMTLGELFCCHGTPDSDTDYLLEEVTAHGVGLRDDASLSQILAGITAPIIVCGHSHVPRAVALADGRLIVNPGSVGVSAYEHDAPYPHVMEAGSPHARFALLCRGAAGWAVELLAVPYDWRAAAAVARENGRSDRAGWIATGRAALPQAGEPR